MCFLCSGVDSERQHQASLTLVNLTLLPAAVGGGPRHGLSYLCPSCRLRLLHGPLRSPRTSEVHPGRPLRSPRTSEVTRTTSGVTPDDLWGHPDDLWGHPGRPLGSPRTTSGVTPDSE
ncbi:hypothetical protein KUCAC02_034422 [Chaenocephalus aceratus]|nr:hypothetical protein KUCAC02_034422 [Chaenocephalus aceratus]